MACSQCQSGGANVFGKRQAQSKLKRYRMKGPDKTTRLLLDALKAEGVAGLTLLDIGGGIGTIGLELLKAGVSAVTEVEASPAYVVAAQSESARQGVTDHCEVREGDFVALTADLPRSGIVTLDRVICCYPHMPALVGQSADKAVNLWGAVYPRDAWWVRVSRTAVNLTLRLLRNPFRLYIHPTMEVDTVLRESGLAPRFHRNGGYWQVVVYGRTA
jgi:magnesium-protoporphyrin O-methyltransferase